MTPNEIRAHVLRELANIAPEADPSTIAGDASLREQLDIDSFDFLRLITALHRTLGVDIPEADYARLATLDGAVAYLEERLAHGEAPSVR